MVTPTDDVSLQTAQAFVANAPISMALLSLDGRLLAVSPPLLQATPAAATDAAIGDNLVAMVPLAGPNLADVLDELRHGAAIIQTEYALADGAGGEAHARAQTSYWRDAAGEPAAVLCVVQDISGEIAARNALAESAAQLRAVVEHMPAQISLMDLENGRILLLNGRMKESLATYSGSHEGACVDDVLGHEERTALEAMLAEAERSRGWVEVETTMEDGVAAGRSFRMKYVIFRDARGRRQLLWMAEDSTELREAAEALQRAAEEAAAANRAKSEFLANMSHEIRTPLNGVMGVAGALARTGLSGPQREMVSLIETSAKTLETLLSDILDLARIEAGKMELKPEPFDLAASVGACGALFDAAAQAKGLDLEVAIAPDALGTYVGDAARLRQILSNLLGNAVKFTHVGGVRLTVLASRGETSSELRFEVRDTGIGFDAETKGRLFSRFEQADGSITRRFGGSGLGLSISRSLAEAMDGRLEADGEPGEGAVFTLTLELPRGEGALDLWDAAAPPEPAADPLEGMRVLLAEDHPTNRRVVELILGAAGVDLTCVENGVEAVAAFRDRNFDHILMDMQMPLLDGLAAVEEIRRLERLSNARPTPIHMLTANAMPEHVNASLAAGADGHLSKPILADALLNCLIESPGRAAVAA